jgi:hypothetical protein
MYRYSTGSCRQPRPGASEADIYRDSACKRLLFNRHVQAAQSAVEQTRPGVAQYAVEQKSRVVSQFVVAKTRLGEAQLL